MWRKITKLCDRNEMLLLSPKKQIITGYFIIIFNTVTCTHQIMHKKL